MLMAGGRGTRLWPLSRRDLPKQFVAFASEKPMVREAFERAARVAEPARVFVVAEEPLLAMARAVLPEIPPENYIAEPGPRGTGPASFLGTLYAGERFGPSTVVAMFPTDHAIPDEAAFAESAEKAFESAGKGVIVTFGITPTRPDAGYGYIEAGDLVSAEEPPVYAVRSFTEKPGEARARRYLSAGNYYWNSGIFFWRADTLIGAWEALRPDEIPAVERLAADIKAGRPPASYGDLEATSVDYAIMEQHEPVVMVKAGFRWDDLGTFEALERVRVADADGNVTEGEVYTLASSGNIVLARGRRPVAVLGGEGLVVVDAGDVLLVYTKGEGARVREIVSLLEDRRPDLV